jgi:hypothetical protein
MMQMVSKTRALKNPTKLATGPAARFAKFGPPPFIDGEDAAASYELLAQFCDEVKPVGVIEEMLVYDVACLEWDLLRFLRIRTSMMRVIVKASVKKVLPTVFQYTDLPFGDLIEPFADTLIKHVQKEGKSEARKFARQLRRDEPEAIEKANSILRDVGQEMGRILAPLKAEKVEELTRGYARGEPDAIRQVTELLAANGLTVHDLWAEGLMEKVEGEAKIAELARLDRLIAIVETRRNATLRLIDIRRVGLGEAVRRTVQQVEADFNVIEMPSRAGKRAN